MLQLRTVLLACALASTLQAGVIQERHNTSDSNEFVTAACGSSKSDQHIQAHDCRTAFLSLPFEKDGTQLTERKKELERVHGTCKVTLVTSNHHSFQVSAGRLLHGKSPANDGGLEALIKQCPEMTGSIMIEGGTRHLGGNVMLSVQAATGSSPDEASSYPGENTSPDSQSPSYPGDESPSYPDEPSYPSGGKNQSSSSGPSPPPEDQPPSTPYPGGWGEKSPGTSKNASTSGSGQPSDSKQQPSYPGESWTPSGGSSGSSNSTNSTGPDSSYPEGSWTPSGGMPGSSNSTNATRPDSSYPEGSTYPDESSGHANSTTDSDDSYPGSSYPNGSSGNSTNSTDSNPYPSGSSGDSNSTGSHPWGPDRNSNSTSSTASSDAKCSKGAKLEVDDCRSAFLDLPFDCETEKLQVNQSSVSNSQGTCTVVITAIAGQTIEASSGRLLDGVDGNGGLEEILSQCADMPGSITVDGGPSGDTNVIISIMSSDKSLLVSPIPVSKTGAPKSTESPPPSMSW